MPEIRRMGQLRGETDRPITPYNERDRLQGEQEVMALYVRLQASFYSHRKTAKLRSALGDDALWLVPRLWCYAATNQPDGDFTKYSAPELALLIGYSKDAPSMLEALQASGFMDEMKIHDWEEHNDYHAAYIDRARKAANARWGNDKKREDKKGQEQACLYDACSIELPFNSEEFQSLWKSWVAHKKQIRKPVTDISAPLQLKKLTKMGETRAIACLEYSVANAYQGLYEENENRFSKGNKPAKSSSCL